MILDVSGGEMGTVAAVLAALAAFVYFAFRKKGSMDVVDIPDLPLTPPPGYTGIPMGAVVESASPFILRASVMEYASRAYLDPALLWGIVMTESSGNPDAQNPSDPSSGLMQITPPIARAFGNVTGSDSEILRKLRDPYLNLSIGTKFVAHLRDRYAMSFPLVEWIQSYNIGETKFDRGIRAPAYGDAVIRNSQTWRK